MTMTLASKQGQSKNRSGSNNRASRVKFSSTVPQYIYDMQKNAKEVATTMERATVNKK